MDWFERLTGFREQSYDDTRARLRLEGQQLRSLKNGHSYGIGELELVSLQSLRDRVLESAGVPGHLTVRNVEGNVALMHEQPEYAGALFQVASQFNLLEMSSEKITPEHGVTRYQDDHTQGPACAMAAGAATLYRNFFVEVGGVSGQTSERQLDALADLGAYLCGELGCPIEYLWTMHNGYAMCSADGLTSIRDYLASRSANDLDELRGLLRVGLHRDVEVTSFEGTPRPLVSQVFCSALPVAYVKPKLPTSLWHPFAQLVLEAAYEATVWAAVLHAQRGASRTLLLTRLGGGAFGNEDAWIDSAMRRALSEARSFGLDVVLVSYGDTPQSMLELEQAFA
ncbi:MAG: hypothetical protein JWN48_1055 [Myxococcaceae bacterium]|nr:hypothetical protein [Myxococcaceae bacterium]